MPIKLFKCERCDYVHKKEKNIVKHEKKCDAFKTCDHCKNLSFWWGTFYCTNDKSCYKNKVIVACTISTHSCEYWKRKKG